MRMYARRKCIPLWNAVLVRLLVAFPRDKSEVRIASTYAEDRVLTPRGMSMEQEGVGIHFPFLSFGIDRGGSAYRNHCCRVCERNVFILPTKSPIPFPHRCTLMGQEGRTCRHVTPSVLICCLCMWNDRDETEAVSRMLKQHVSV